MLHVSYQISHDLNFVVMCAIDAHGEAHELRACYIGVEDGDGSELLDKVVSCIMAFTWDFCARTSQEWTVVIAKSGTMPEAELIAWERCLQRDVADQDQAIHVTIACVEHSPMIPFLAPSSARTPPSFPNVPHHPKWVFNDMTSTTIILSPFYRMPLFGGNPRSFGPDVLIMDDNSPLSTPTPPLLALCSSYLITCPATADRSTNVHPGTKEYSEVITSLQFHILHVRASRSSSLRKTLYDLQEDILKNYCALAVLSRERWATFNYGGMPFHVAAVEMMRTALLFSKLP